MTRIIIGILLGLLGFVPAQAFEFYTTGPVEPSILIGMDHQPGEEMMSEAYGMARRRGSAMNDATMSHFGIHGLEEGERSDYPCFLAIDFTQLTGGDVPAEDLIARGQPFDRCGRNRVRARSLENIGSDGSLDQWATGLSVCREGNGRIKGLSLISTLFRVNRDTKTLEVGGTNTDGFSRANCTNWTPEVSCRANHLMVGLDVFYMEDNNGRREADSIIGFRLQCRELAFRN